MSVTPVISTNEQLIKHIKKIVQNPLTVRANRIITRPPSSQCSFCGKEGILFNFCSFCGALLMSDSEIEKGDVYGF